MAADTTPLLAAAENEDKPIQTIVSDCKLQDKCFLSEGAAGGRGGYNKVQRKLTVACILCFIFMIVEVIGGYVANSVAIMSDAAHMLSDVSAFLVSIFAAWAATQPSSWHYSFGYHRAEILGALVSVLTIWAVTGALVFEAFQRTIHPVRVDGKLMFIVSMAGVVFNIMIALTLGVHAHLGHSHGPDGGCSHGHSHDHPGHSHAGHDHSAGHEHYCSSEGHSHSHSEGGKGHKHQHSSCSSHSHDDKAAEGAHPSQSNGLHACSGHGHHHDHDHSSHSHSSDDESEHQHQHEHSHDQPRKEVVITIPAAIAPAAAAGDAGHCGQAGHAVSCRCTISRRGSREIEVRCELPLPAAAVAAAAAGASATRRSEHSHEHEPGSINLRSAVLHVIGDLLQSIGVAIAGALIWYNQDDPRWYLADPICTFAFSILVLLTTRYVLRDIVHVLMERTPANMHLPTVSQELMAMDGIQDVHDLHIWNISTSTAPVLTAHVHIGPDADANDMLQKLEKYVRRIGIEHSTIQICNPVTVTAHEP